MENSCNCYSLEIIETPRRWKLGEAPDRLHRVNPDWTAGCLPWQIFLSKPMDLCISSWLVRDTGWVGCVLHQPDYWTCCPISSWRVLISSTILTSPHFIFWICVFKSGSTLPKFLYFAFLKPIFTYMSVTRWRNKEDAVHIHNGIYYSAIKGMHLSQF